MDNSSRPFLYLFLWPELFFFILLYQLLSCWYVIICIKGLTMLFSDNCVTQNSHFQWKWRHCDGTPQMNVVWESERRNYCIIEWVNSRQAFFWFPHIHNIMASSTKHNPTATTCITIKTLEKSFERKNKNKSKWFSTNIVHKTSCLSSEIQKKAVYPKGLWRFLLQRSSTDETKSNVNVPLSFECHDWLLTPDV